MGAAYLANEALACVGRRPGLDVDLVQLVVSADQGVGDGAAKTFISCVTPMPLTINATTATISAREVRVPVQ